MARYVAFVRLDIVYFSLLFLMVRVGAVRFMKEPYTTNTRVWAVFASILGLRIISISLSSEFRI